MEKAETKRLLNLIFSGLAIVVTALIIVGLFGGLVKTYNPFGTSEKTIIGIFSDIKTFFESLKGASGDEIVTNIQLFFKDFFIIIGWIGIAIATVFNSIFVILGAVRALTKNGDFRDSLKPLAKLCFSCALYAQLLLLVYYQKGPSEGMTIGWGVWLCLICGYVGMALIVFSQVIFLKNNFLVFILKALVAFGVYTIVAFLFIAGIKQGQRNLTVYQLFPHLLDLFKSSSDIGSIKDKIGLVFLAIGMIILAEMGTRLLTKVVINGLGLNSKRQDRRGEELTGNKKGLIYSIIGGICVAVGLIVSSKTYVNAFGSSYEMGIAPIIFAVASGVIIILLILINIFDANKGMYHQEETQE